jgi:cyclopropane fatty-acyl-phospholipid synthase-like methyltransferase
VGIREEAELQQTYERRYRPAMLAAGIAAEREAVGSDYGANGYTTLEQADALLPLLGVRAGDRLLDVGSGCGWPGLYLAQRTGCHVVVADLTAAGMRQAVKRAADDGIGARTAAVMASARHLPFRPDSFDAIVHADVLC